MKKLTVIISSITAIGFAVKNMGQMTTENVLLYGVVLFFSYVFFRAMWKLIDDKKDDKKPNRKQTKSVKVQKGKTKK